VSAPVTAVVDRLGARGAKGAADPAVLLPPGRRLELLPGPDGLPPRTDIGIGPALLRTVDGTDRGVLRVYRPAATLAFSRSDALAPGFARAVEVAGAHGFAPVVRSLGGHAAAYHQDAVCLELAVGDPDPRSALRDRFVAFADLAVRTLQDLGVDTRYGPVPGEYCPGQHSVNGAGLVKLVGTAQRLGRRGWLLGVVVLVDGSAPARDAVADVYDALDLPCDPDTVAAVADLLPGVTVTEVADAFVAAFAAQADLVPTALPADLLDDAARLAAAHPALPRTCAISRARLALTGRSPR
jgi:octanoyl-[GcvH]:protein N-octanoyltransferase